MGRPSVTIVVLHRPVTEKMENAVLRILATVPGAFVRPKGDEAIELVVGNNPERETL
jgi:hypothetical protein